MRELISLANGRYAIGVLAALAKDQTYALYNLDTRTTFERHVDASRTVFKKDEIRKIAEKIGLLVANKPDSQDICFVPDGDYAAYIEENAGAKIPEGNL